VLRKNTVYAGYNDRERKYETSGFLSNTLKLTNFTVTVKITYQKGELFTKINILTIQTLKLKAKGSDEESSVKL
jgi:hypothetical protein